MAREADRRLAGIVVTVLVHAALILAWHMARTSSSPQAEVPSSTIQWIRLPGAAPAQAPDSGSARTQAAEPGRSSRPVPVRVEPRRQEGLPPATIQAAPVPAPAGAALPSATEATAPAAEAAGPALPAGESILERARRSVGSVDRALRKENRPTITMPPDSPQIRMRKGMEQAHAMAPPRLWEAPKVDELVNNTGDGARRTRVITGNGTYCVTDRAPVTSIDMIEKHGKQRFTTCPEHEEPAKKQEWRTARD